MFELAFEFDLYGFTDGVRGFDQSVELYRQIGWALQAAQLRAAGGHALGHGYFAEFAGLHGIVQLYRLVDAVFFEQVVKVTAKMEGGLRTHSPVRNVWIV